ncbi:MAG: ATP-binding protein [Bacteroidota bacterium]
MKYCTTRLLLGMGALLCIGQLAYATPTDSLADLARQSPNAQKAGLYLQLSQTLGLEDPSAALAAAREAIHWAQRTEDIPALAEALLYQGRWLRYTGATVAAVDSALAAAESYATQAERPDLRFYLYVEWAWLAWWRNHRPDFNAHLAGCESLLPQLQGPAERATWAWLNATWQYRDHLTDSADANYERAYAFYKQAGDTEGQFGVALDLAMVRLRQRQPLASKALRREVLEGARAQGSTYWEFRSLVDEVLHATYQPQYYTPDSIALLKAATEDLAQRQPNLYGQFRYYYYKAITMKDTGHAPEALPFVNKYQALARQLHIANGVIRAATYLAAIRIGQGYVDWALRDLLAVSDLAVETHYMVERVHALLAKMSYYNGEHANALQYRQKGVASALAFRSTQPYYFYSDYYADYGQYYGAMGQVAIANQYLDSAMLVASENEDWSRMITAVQRKGEIAIDEEAWDQVKTYMFQVEDLIAKPELQMDPEGIAFAQRFIAEGHFGLRNYAQAIAYGEKSLASNEHTAWFGGILDDHELLWKAYEASGRASDALVHLKAYQSLKDSLFTLEKTQTYLSLRETWEAEKRQLEIDLLQQENELNGLTLAAQEDSLTRNRFLLSSTLILALVLGIVAWLVFTRYKLRKRADQLSLQNESYRLEQENAEAKQQLEMSKLRANFLANVSHEIRTPLTLIKGPLEEWQHRPEVINAKQVGRMQEQVHHLMGLVNEAMQVAKSDQEPVPLNPQVVSLGPYLQKQVEAFQSQAQQLEVALSVEDSTQGALFAVDTARMESILNNLLSNALRYTPPGGSIAVRLSQSTTQLLLTVEDTGAGIDAQHLPYLFERYYRADADEQTGYGLGLALVKEAAEMHQGRVSVRSQLGAGTTFQVRIPLSAIQPLPAAPAIPQTEVPTATPKPATAPAPTGDQPTVLVIEDHPELRTYLQEILCPHYTVYLAADGAEGEQMARSLLPDLVVSDVMMPRKDGLEVLESLKGDVLTSHIPVVLLTAKAALEDRLAGLESGADHYLSKPFSPEELLLCLRNLLQQQERLRQQFQIQYSSGAKAVENGKCTLQRNRLDEEFLNRAQTVVEEQLENEALTIEQFCEALALNRTSVHKKLKALTGFNTSSFIKSVRIEKAKELMQQPEHTIASVAHMTGFSNRQSFNRAFKEQTGVAPSAYRDQVVE